MANVRLSWLLPSVSPRQRPLEHTIIDARVAAELPWTAISNVPANLPSELVIEDSAPGRWFFRARAFDDQGTPGPEATTQVDVGFDPPGAIAEFSATLE